MKNGLSMIIQKEKDFGGSSDPSNVSPKEDLHQKKVVLSIW